MLKENRVFIETFIKTYKNRINKYMASTTKNENINKLDVIIKENNMTNQNEIYLDKKNADIHF